MPLPTQANRRQALAIARLASSPTSRIQIYASRSRDPFFNLSLEHHLLKTSNPDSTVLLLYVNRPCVVIGRNQNPWLEVNLPLLRAHNARARFGQDGRPVMGGGVTSSSSSTGSSTTTASDFSRQETQKHRLTLAGAPLPPPLGGNVPVESDRQGLASLDWPIELVRRRSGGGTVFHDEGNMNYCVICPPSVFDRNKHAVMVVRALRSLGVETAHVNQRHDIVVADPSATTALSSSRSPSSSQPTPPLVPSSLSPTPTLKVSGSAYKLTRLRALHHGTCLLASPHLALISAALRSPAAPFIRARGVESVRSRVCNVGLGLAEFERAVKTAFVDEYGSPDVEVEVGEREDEVAAEFLAGIEELRSLDWIYGQTPQFTLSSHPTEGDPRERPRLPFESLQLSARHGVLNSISYDHRNMNPASADGARGLWKIEAWPKLLADLGLSAEEAERVGEWMGEVLGTAELKT